MPTNPFFNNFSESQEQTLIEDLVVEAIKMHGIDVYYLPRNVLNKDEVILDDKLSTFNKAILIEMYIKNVEGFEGEGDLLGKFGLEIRDRMTMTMSRRSFFEEVELQTTLTRPREGDLVYFPLNRKFFEIRFVEHEAVFYQMGSLQAYDLVLELFDYNHETFATGITAIDNRFTDLTHDASANGFVGVEETDTQADNETIQAEANVFIDFSNTNPFSTDGRW